MRTLFVASHIAARFAGFATLTIALSASAASLNVALAAPPTSAPVPSKTSAPTVHLAPKAGQSITQSELLGYLFVAPQAGDWLRYRVAVDDKTILVKTVGFGVERLGDIQRAFVETRTRVPGLVSSPVVSQTVAGGDVVWKMFVNAGNFDDPTRLYSFVAGMVRIGDAFFRIGKSSGEQPRSAYHQTLQSLLLYGTLPLPGDRSGTVLASQPEDVRVGGTTVHAVHTTVDFAAHNIGIAAGLPRAHVEIWQTTDVPLGIVSIRSTTNGHVYSVAVTAYGRSFHSAITRPFDSIPYFPG